MRQNPIPERVVAAVLAGSMLVAPFIALLYRAEAGLAAMVAALLATAFLLREVDASTAGNKRQWVRLAIALNLSLAIACVGLILLLLSGR
jgi:hypothetical protein